MKRDTGSRKMTMLRWFGSTEASSVAMSGVRVTLLRMRVPVAVNVFDEASPATSPCSPAWSRVTMGAKSSRYSPTVPRAFGLVALGSRSSHQCGPLFVDGKMSPWR
eukprot:Amastigsp_a175561_10.p4 type:complete len:106 gc:universal Amastigsp_a175561_10:618-301(-)